MAAGENVRAPTNHKATPFKKNEVWQELTDLPDKKQGPATLLTDGKETCETILNPILLLRKSRQRMG